jgi:hypothetical protein
MSWVQVPFSAPNFENNVMNDPTIKVTRIKQGLWGIRCFAPNGGLFMESKVKSKILIGTACKDLLRWWDKCGGTSKYASAARHRYK